MDLRLRSGASLHLTWGAEVGEKVRKEGALREELVREARELPGWVEPEAKEEGKVDKGKGKEVVGGGGDKKAEGKARSKEGIEGKLKGLLRLSKK